MISIWSRQCHCHPIISCFIKIQNGLTFLVSGYPGCPGNRLINGCLQFLHHFNLYTMYNKINQLSDKILGIYRVTQKTNATLCMYRILWYVTYSYPLRVERRVTGQLADCQLAHCQLVDWMTCRLVNSRTGQVADWTTRGCHRRLCVLSFSSFGGICETTSCPVRDLSSPRDVQSTSWQSASWRIHELFSYRKKLA